MKLPVILFPCDYFEPFRVDDSFKAEYEAARLQGFPVALVKENKLLEEGTVEIVTSPSLIPGGTESLSGLNVIYRGWMLKVDQYQKLMSQLYTNFGLFPITWAPAYETCHHFDKAFVYINYLTPKIVVLRDPINFRYTSIFGIFKKYFIMKDNAKSLKNTTFPNKIPMYITDEEFNQLVVRFIKERGALYTGQIILKQFIDLMTYNTSTNEYRAFYYDGQLISFEKNSNQIGTCPSPPMNFVKTCGSLLPSKFFTIDFAETIERDWQILECGDGQVSGLSPTQNALEFYFNLKTILEKQ